jgi:hypothetical protein
MSNRSMNGSSNGNGGPGRPSDARRKALNAELTVPSVSNFFPIENYYDAADKVYESFQLAFQQSQGSQKNGSKQKTPLDDAYVYGKRYCTFCINAIPEHNYYNAVRYRSLQVQHTRQVTKVLTQLEQVATEMDKEELEKQRQREIHHQKKQEERENIERKQYEDLQRRVQKQMQQSKAQSQHQNSDVRSDPDNLEASALSKLELLMRKPAPSAPEDYSIRRDPSGEEPRGEPSTRYRLNLDDDDDSSVDENGAFPPPMLPPSSSSNGSLSSSSEQQQPNAPPSYDQALRSRPFLGPGVKHPVGTNSNKNIPMFGYTPPTAPEQAPPRKQPGKEGAVPPMKQQQKKFVQDYLRHQREGKIEVTAIDTYQGRTRDSTNGCTVISALVAAFHLVSHGGITNSQVCQVIDRECGPLLREIRSKLGLGESALIIPSDVHDHLVDRKVLHQKHFEGAAGGNIMDPDHFGEFIKLISVGDDGKAPWSRKAAATLFFREHVISIVKFPVGPNQVFYDLVDSLPGLAKGGRNLASRTRCKDVKSLEVLLRWYTSRKFSDSNCAHIDCNPWDDNMADMDPRVFQGFVWAAKQ